MFTGLTSLQDCMDSSCSSDWLQGTMQEESSSPSGEMLTCSRPPMMERLLRPQHEQAIKCPRCDSTHTKFCYYNNYSLTQPRYFCKTCRRYWTKGGTLRNIPVGGGCRKNKKLSSSKKPADVVPPNLGNTNTVADDLHLSSFPGCADTRMPMTPHFNNLLAAAANGFVPLDYMDSKLEALVGSSSCNNYDFMGGGGFGSDHLAPSFHGFCGPYGIGMSSLDGSGAANFNERVMLPFEAGDHNQMNAAIDVKPNPKALSLEWHDHFRSDAEKDGGALGYNLNSIGSWTGMMNGYGPSTSNPLV